MHIHVPQTQTNRWRGLRILVKPPPRAASVGWAARIGDLLAYDFFPDIDKVLIDWARRPLGILALAILFSTLCGFVIHPHGFVLAGTLMLIVVTGLLWPWLSILGLKTTLQFETSRATEREEVPVRIIVSNRMPWCAWGLGLQLTESSRKADVGLSHACGWKTTEAAWSFIPAHRGEYPTGKPHLFCGFPFGLWNARREMIVDQPLLVWPSTFPVGAIPEVSGSEFHEGHAFRNKPGTAGDILGVRPFRDGDTLRRVHWPQTARHGRLIVCERQTPSLPSIQIVLDTYREPSNREGTTHSREWSIRVAASLVAGWLDQGAQIEIVVQGKAISQAGGTRQRNKIFDSLARIKSDGDPTLAELLLLPACRRPHSTITVLITTDASLLSPSLDVTSLQKMHVVVLRAAGFDGEDSSVTPPDWTLPIRPWIEVKDAKESSTCFRKTWKGASHAG